MIYIKSLKSYSLFILCGLFIFSSLGCSTINAPRSPYEPWQPNKGQRQDLSKDDTWASIQETWIVSDEPLGLAELVDISLENNPSTQQAWQSARAKAAELTQADSTLYPQVTVTADGTREKSVPNTAPDGNVNNLKYGPGGEASLLIFDFGGRNAEIEEAYHALLSANYEFNQAIQDLLLEVSTAYYNLYSGYLDLEAAESDVVDSEKSYEAAKYRHEVGLAPKLDQLQARADFDDSLYNLEDAKGSVETARANLARVLGVSSDASIEIAPPRRELPTGITQEDVSALIEQALSQRPDIAALRAELQEKEASIRVATADLLPEITLGGTYGHDWYKYYNTEAARDDSYEYTGYLKLKWDVFDGFSNIAKRDEAKALAEEMRARLKQAELDASADVWTKYYEYNTAVRKLKFSKSFLKSSMASHELALDGYAAGVRSILDLLQAQSNLSKARAQIVQSQRDVFVAITGLSHATGTLTASELEAD